jgi:hypothetical protein
MSAQAMLSRESVRFREALIRALWDERAFGYIDQDRFLGSCPVCGGAVEVRFHGNAARADLRCQLGCTEAEIVAALRKEGHPR